MSASERVTRFRSRGDFLKFDQVEAERFDLRDDAEQRGPIWAHAGEHRVAAFWLRGHRRKGGQGGGSEAPPYPDPVQGRRFWHGIILHARMVSAGRRNLMIVKAR